mmetsp:Transcript_21150/g.38444  ORF Transcript_21150/g.38444 Transcript_21150/m.38444 type:complete len:104 (+) Transcript_21150:585-896(+)
MCEAIAYPQEGTVGREHYGRATAGNVWERGEDIKKAIAKAPRGHEDKAMGGLCAPQRLRKQSRGLADALQEGATKVQDKDHEALPKGRRRSPHPIKICAKNPG